MFYSQVTTHVFEFLQKLNTTENAQFSQGLPDQKWCQLSNCQCHVSWMRQLEYLKANLSTTASRSSTLARREWTDRTAILERRSSSMVVLRCVFISFKQLKDRSDATDVIGIVQAIFNNRFTSKNASWYDGIWPESLQMRPTYRLLRLLRKTATFHWLSFVESCASAVRSISILKSSSFDL